MSKLLIVDDDEDAVALLGEYLSSLGHTVQVACAAEEAMQLAPAFHPDVLIVDFILGSMQGTDVIRQLRHQGLQMGVLIMTGLPSYEVQHAITADLGAIEIRMKPVSLDEIAALVTTLGRVGNSAPAGFH